MKELVLPGHIAREKAEAAAPVITWSTVIYVDRIMPKQPMPVGEIFARFLAPGIFAIWSRYDEIKMIKPDLRKLSGLAYEDTPSGCRISLQVGQIDVEATKKKFENQKESNKELH
jgi:hypothetical protein